MNTQTVVEILKKEADKDTVFKDVAHVFAQRKRARRQVTVTSLAARMAKEGFDYSKSEYARVLKRLSDLGLGSLQQDARGRIKALKDIKISLQSIGAAAVGSSKNLVNRTDRIKFNHLSLPEAEAIAKGIAASAAKDEEKAEQERDKKAILIAAHVPTVVKRVILIKEGRAIELTTEDIGIINEVLYGPERQGSA